MDDQRSEYLYTQSIIAESYSQSLYEENARLRHYIKSLEKQLLDMMSVIIDIHNKNDRYPKD